MCRQQPRWWLANFGILSLAVYLLCLLTTAVHANVDHPVSCIWCHAKVIKGANPGGDPYYLCPNVKPDQQQAIQLAKVTTMKGNINWQSSSGNTSYTASISNSNLYEKYWRQQGNTHIFLANPQDAVKRQKMWTLYCNDRKNPSNSGYMIFYLNNDDACQYGDSSCAYDLIDEINVWNNLGP